jgi:hypothetical protein
LRQSVESVLMPYSQGLGRKVLPFGVRPSISLLLFSSDSGSPVLDGPVVRLWLTIRAMVYFPK